MPLKEMLRRHAARSNRCWVGKEEECGMDFAIGKGKRGEVSGQACRGSRGSETELRQKGGSCERAAPNEE